MSPIVPLPYPSLVRTVEIACRRGTAPEVEIERFRNLLGLLPERSARSSVKTKDLNLPDASKFAGIDDEFLSVQEVRRAATLHPDLDDGVVLARRFEHRLAFANVDSDRLLHVNVASRLDRGDRRERVPMIRRSDKNDVESAFGEHLAIVVERFRLPSVLTFRDAAFRVLERVAIDVA